MKTYTEINEEKTKPMEPGNLCLTMRNDQASWTAFLSHIDNAFRVVDRTATANAKANALWHDEPTADDHKDYHASADKQYPFPVRRADFMEAMECALDHLEDSRRKRYLVKFTGRKRGALGIGTAREEIVWAHNEEDAVRQLFYCNSYRFEYTHIGKGKKKNAMYCEVSEIASH